MDNKHESLSEILIEYTLRARKSRRKKQIKSQRKDSDVYFYSYSM